MSDMEYKIKLADGKRLSANKVEITDKGIKFPIGDEGVIRFVPYEAILWIDHKE